MSELMLEMLDEVNVLLRGNRGGFDGFDDMLWEACASVCRKHNMNSGPNIDALMDFWRKN